MKDFPALSIAAIPGASLRYLPSRGAAREFGPVFPLGTLIINVSAASSMSFLKHGQWGWMLTDIFGNHLLCLAGASAGMGLARAFE